MLLLVSEKEVIEMITRSNHRFMFGVDLDKEVPHTQYQHPHTDINRLACVLEEPELHIKQMLGQIHITGVVAPTNVSETITRYKAESDPKKEMMLLAKLAVHFIITDS